MTPWFIRLVIVDAGAESDYGVCSADCIATRRTMRLALYFR